MVKRGKSLNKRAILIPILLVLVGALIAFAAPKINNSIKANGGTEPILIPASVLQNQSAAVIPAMTDNAPKKETAQKTNAKVSTAQVNTSDPDYVTKIRAQSEAERAASAAAQADSIQFTLQILRNSATKEEQVRAIINQANISYLGKLSAINKSFSIDGLDLYNSAINSYNSGNIAQALSSLSQAKAVFEKANRDAIRLFNDNSNMSKDYIQAGADMQNAASYAVKATDEMISIINTHTTVSASDYGAQLENYGAKVQSFLVSQGYK